jgi:uncharacterized protein YbjT (DUF2867 family)
MTTESPDAGAERRVLLAGASGLVGGLCLRQLLAGALVDEVVAVARRPLPVTDRRLRVIVTEFDQLAQVPAVPARAALCAIGSTIAKAGGQEAFRKIDRDVVVAFARWARAGGARTFVLVSSVGAAPDAHTFYVRVKGEAEEAVGSLGFPR